MPFAEVGGALQSLQASPAFTLMNNAIANAPRTSAAQFRTSLEQAWRNTASGWTAGEFRFTAIQPQGQGRPRAIDFCNVAHRVGVELELSNQNAITHDLLKLETSHWNQLTDLGVLVVPTIATRETNGWQVDNFYATYEYAEEWLRVFTPSLRSPIVVWGF